MCLLGPGVVWVFRVLARVFSVVGELVCCVFWGGFCLELGFDACWRFSWWVGEFIFSMSTSAIESTEDVLVLVSTEDVVLVSSEAEEFTVASEGLLSEVSSSFTAGVVVDGIMFCKILCDGMFSGQTTS